MFATATPPKHSAKQTRRPPNLPVTTPETFQLMFSGKNLRHVEHGSLVVDEVHDLAASERGWQLGVGLSRLEALTGRPVQRLGLRRRLATLMPSLTGFRPARPNRSSRRVSASRNSRLNRPRRFPRMKSALLTRLSPKQHAAYRHLCRILRTQSPCLVFVNSRSDAETLSTRLRRWHLTQDRRIT